MTCSGLASDFVVLVLVLSEAVLSPPRRTVLSETVLVLDGCLNCGDADRRSRRFAVTCFPDFESWSPATSVTTVDRSHAGMIQDRKF